MLDILLSTLPTSAYLIFATALLSLSVYRWGNRSKKRLVYIKKDRRGDSKLHSLASGKYYSYEQLRNMVLRIKISTYFSVLCRVCSCIVFEIEVLRYTSSWLRTYSIAKISSQTYSNPPESASWVLVRFLRNIRGFTLEDLSSYAEWFHCLSAKPKRLKSSWTGKGRMSFYFIQTPIFPDE